MVFFNTSNISSDCCIHFLEEVEQTEEIRTYIPMYDPSNENYWMNIFSAIK